LVQKIFQKLLQFQQVPQLTGQKSLEMYCSNMYERSECC
jgi:hypothetical protein